MRKSEDNGTVAAVLLRDFFAKHLARGTGNSNKAQTASAFAIRSGLSPSRISEWRKSKGGLPTTASLDAIERVFFPDREGRNSDPAYLEWGDVRRAIVNHGLPGAPDPDAKAFSPRETWDLLIRPVSRNTFSIVRSAPDDAGVGILRREQIAARLTDAAFVLPMPTWFLDELHRDAFLRERYDVHSPVDLSGATDFAHLYDSVPIKEFPTVIAYHTEAHARFVIQTLRRNPSYPPYNKKKAGLRGYQQSQRSGRHEGLYLDLDFYETDYHTHRVMRRVLHDVRASHPQLFRDDADPYDALPYLPYFTTSFGVNIVVTTQEPREKRFYMARLSKRQGNINQQGLWHVAANEGVSLEDACEGRVDIGHVVARALVEELGHRYVEADETLYLEFAIDRRNMEPFIACVTHLSTDRESFYRCKQHMARDDRREFQEMRDFPFSEQAVIELLLGDPSGTNGFTSYCLNILDSLLVRGLAPRLSA